MKHNIPQILQKIENLLFNLNIIFSWLNFNNCTPFLQFKDEMLVYSAVVRVKLLGRHPEQWRPQWYLILCLFGLKLVPSRSRAEPWWGQGAKPLEPQKNLHPILPKTGSKTDQKHSDGYAFLHVHCSTKSQENFKKVQNFEFSTFLSEAKCVCFIFPAGQYFTNFKSKQRVTDQCQDRSYTLQHLCNFSKFFFIPYNFMPTA